MATPSRALSFSCRLYPDKMFTHRKYFCGESAQRTEAQAKTQRKGGAPCEFSLGSGGGDGRAIDAAWSCAVCSGFVCLLRSCRTDSAARRNMTVCEYVGPRLKGGLVP